MLPPQLRYVADLQSIWTPCGNRLHLSCEEVEGAMPSPGHFADLICLTKILANAGCRAARQPWLLRYASQLRLGGAVLRLNGHSLEDAQIEPAQPIDIRRGRQFAFGDRRLPTASATCPAFRAGPF